MFFHCFFDMIQLAKSHLQKASESTRRNLPNNFMNKNQPTNIFFFTSKLYLFFMSILFKQRQFQKQYMQRQRQQKEKWKCERNRFAALTDNNNTH